MNIPFLDRFPVKVFIFQRRGKGSVIKEDRARYIEDNESGKRMYELKDKGQNAIPIPFKYIQTTNDGNPVIFLYEYDRNHFKPIEANVSDNELDIAPVDEADIAWEQYTKGIAEEIHEAEVPWYQKYQSYLTLIILGFFMIVFSYLFMKRISTVGMNVANALEGAASSAGSVPG